MKNLTLALVSIFIAISFVGCASSSPSTPNNKMVKINDGATKSKSSLLIKIKTDDVKPIQKIASALNEAAKVFKTKGITHFKISQKYLIDKKTNGLSNYVTDLKSLEEFCFPKQSGLEDKCEKLTHKTLKLWIHGKTPVFYEPTWSVIQVLNDPYVKQKAVFNGHTTMTVKEAFKKF